MNYIRRLIRNVVASVFREQFQMHLNAYQIQIAELMRRTAALETRMREAERR